MSAIIRQMPEVQNTLPSPVHSGAPNRGIIYIGCKAYSKRKGDEHSADAVVNRIRGPLSGISGALVLPSCRLRSKAWASLAASSSRCRTRVAHSGRTGECHPGHGAPGQFAQGPDRLISAAYTANDPQFLVTIDREKAKSLHVPLQQITDTLGVYMGSAYVNDFDFNNRSYRVYVQADKQFRSQAKDIKQYYVRSDSGAMIPLENLVTITQTTTPQVISHYNLFRSAEIDGSRRRASARARPSRPWTNSARKFCRKVSPTSGQGCRWKNWRRAELQSYCSAWECWSSI